MYQVVFQQVRAPADMIRIQDRDAGTAVEKRVVLDDEGGAAVIHVGAALKKDARAIVADNILENLILLSGLGVKRLHSDALESVVRTGVADQLHVTGRRRIDRDADVRRCAGQPFDADEVGVEFQTAPVGADGLAIQKGAVACAHDSDERVG